MLAAKNQIGLHEICFLDSSTNQKKKRKAAFRQPGWIFKCLVEILSPCTGI